MRRSPAGHQRPAGCRACSPVRGRAGARLHRPARDAAAERKCGALYVMLALASLCAFTALHASDRQPRFAELAAMICAGTGMTVIHLLSEDRHTQRTGGTRVWRLDHRGDSRTADVRREDSGREPAGPSPWSLSPRAGGRRPNGGPRDRPAVAILEARHPGGGDSLAPPISRVRLSWRAARP